MALTKKELDSMKVRRGPKNKKFEDKVCVPGITIYPLNSTVKKLGGPEKCREICLKALSSALLKTA
jgi:hypothetical protein